MAPLKGNGRAVWQAMREENPAVFWRSRRGNPVNPFYFAECDGCLKQPDWKVFWYGIDDLGAVARCVAHCGTRPATLGAPTLEQPA